MSEASVTGSTAGGSHRRGFLRWVNGLLAAAVAGVLAVPGVGYVLTPLLRSGKGGKGFTTLARLGELEEGVPRAFPVIEGREDAWVRYPAEPVGSVWLVRQPEGAKEAVLAFTAECPHLACAINLSPDASQFFCPCHTSSFTLAGVRVNSVSPRDMDRLEVEPLDATNPAALVRVRFQRFRTMSEEKISLA
jgi:Rieske Fe-S protein